MVQLTAIIFWEITQRHKYLWHVTTKKYIIMFLSKDIQIYSLSINFRCLFKDRFSICIVFLIDNIMMIWYEKWLRNFMIITHQLLQHNL